MHCFVSCQWCIWLTTFVHAHCLWNVVNFLWPHGSWWTLMDVAVVYWSLEFVPGSRSLRMASLSMMCILLLSLVSAPRIYSSHSLSFRLLIMVIVFLQYNNSIVVYRWLLMYIVVFYCGCSNRTQHSPRRPLSFAMFSKYRMHYIMFHPVPKCVQSTTSWDVHCVESETSPTHVLTECILQYFFRHFAWQPAPTKYKQG